MSVLYLFVYWVAGLVVLAESLNKLERTDVRAARGQSVRARVVVAAKALAWLLLAIGAAGAVATPLLPLERPGLQHVCTLLGFAVLIVRTRLKDEAPHP